MTKQAKQAKQAKQNIGNVSALVAEFIGHHDGVLAAREAIKATKEKQAELIEQLKKALPKNKEAQQLELTKATMLAYGVTLAPTIGQRGATWPKAEVLTGESVCANDIEAKRLIERMKKARQSLYNAVFGKPEKEIVELPTTVQTSLKRAAELAIKAGISKAALADFLALQFKAE